MTKTREEAEIGDKIEIVTRSSVRTFVHPGEIVRTTKTMLVAKYRPHAGSRELEDRFYRKDGDRVGDRSVGYVGPYLRMAGHN